MSFIVALSSTLLVLSHGAVRTLEQRRAAGECAVQTSSSEELFPVEYLKSYVSMGTQQIKTIDQPIVSAELIDIKYGRNFKVVTEKMAKEQYVLVQCGSSAPDASAINAIAPLPTGYTRKQFTIPLQKVISESTVQLGFLKALGLHDRVSYVTKYAVGACWQKMISCGGLHNSTAQGQAEQRGAVDAVFVDCPWDYSANKQNCAPLAKIPKAIHFSTSQDPAPLASAEHIKFMAAFFNKEEEAETLFKKSVSSMQALVQQSTAVKEADKPVVAWISLSWDGKNAQLSNPPFKAKLVQQAGAKAVDAEAVKSALGGSLSSSDKAAFLKALADSGVTAVIDETYSSDVANYNFQSFLDSFGIKSDSTLSFIKNKMVIREDSGFSGKSNLDWFESRLPHPALAVEGLQRVLNDDSSKGKLFFRNIAKGEAPVAIKADTCTKTLTACVKSDFPSTLPMINKLGSTPSTSGGSRMGVLVALAFVTCAALFQ